MSSEFARHFVRFFVPSVPTRRQPRLLDPIRAAMIEELESRRLLSAVAVATSTDAQHVSTNTSSLAAPVVTKNPASETIQAGHTATFTAAGHGNPTPTVQWQVSIDGGKHFSNIAHATSTTLNVVTNSAMNGHEYRAVFTNSQGHAVTTAAKLSVAFAPVVAKNPINETIGVGHTATFTAAAHGNPTPTVQWQVSIDGGKHFSNIAHATSTTLHIVTTPSMNGYEYRAVFTNSQGHSVTKAAKLTVTGQFDGTYKVSFAGTVTAFGITTSVPGSFIIPGLNDLHFSVKNGVGTISLPGIGAIGSAKINSDGTLNVKLTGGSVGGFEVTISFAAKFKINSDHSITGTGSWKLTSSFGISGSGTWNVHRSA